MQNHVTQLRLLNLSLSKWQLAQVEVEDDEMPLVPTRHFLQGMPSIGFSEVGPRVATAVLSMQGR